MTLGRYKAEPYSLLLVAFFIYLAVPYFALCFSDSKLVFLIVVVSEIVHYVHVFLMHYRPISLMDHKCKNNEK